MLAFNVSHTQDPRVCHYDCQPDSIGEQAHARASSKIDLLTGLHPSACACSAKLATGCLLQAHAARSNV
jgi:hypothetical protein